MQNKGKEKITKTVIFSFLILKKINHNRNPFFL